MRLSVGDRVPEAQLLAPADHVFGGVSFIRRLEQLSSPTRDNGVWGARKTDSRSLVVRPSEDMRANFLGMTARIAQRGDLGARSAKTSRAAYKPLSAAGKPA